MVNRVNRPERQLAVGMAALAALVSGGCDAIWGVHKAKLYVADAGTGGTTSTSSGGGGGGDGGIGGTGGSGGTGTISCAPFSPQACIDATTLELCNAAGDGYMEVQCERGCGATPEPHCKLVAPTGAAPVSDFLTAGLEDKVLDSSNVIHTDTGEIENGVRAASADPTSLSVSSGIGFHTVTANGNTIGVFVFGKLNVAGSPLKIVGTHPAVLLAANDVNIATINIAADQTTNTPGAGGFAGGTPSVTKGLGPGAGLGGAHGTFFGGAGGAGHGAKGGTGATISSATGGDGGPAYGDPLLGILLGGSGGGAASGGLSNGGAGGGALQIVSQTAINITGGIAAGGAGGRGNANGSCGGGGAGGSILLEAPLITVGDNGFLLTGGGGGGGNADGNPAGDSTVPAFVGLGGLCGTSHCGGQGGYSGQDHGGDGKLDGQTAGCGGGASGRIRINTLTGSASLSANGALYVPNVASSLFTQGVVTIQ